jgi:hypothetical protein
VGAHSLGAALFAAAPFAAMPAAAELSADKQGGAYNNGLIQRFLNYNIESGVYLMSGPILTVDWTADSSQRWPVPLGAALGRSSISASCR